MSHTTNILVLVPFRERHMERLREVAGPDVSFTQEVYPTEERQRALIEELRPEIVFGEPAPTVLAEAPSVRWVQMTWAGTDLYTRGTVPWPAGKTLTNVAGAAYGHIISQYIVGQLLSLAWRFPTVVQQQEGEVWKGAGPVMSLDGARALIFGAGDIGSQTARRLAAFDVHCTGVCRDVSRPREGFERLVTLEEAEAELPGADLVICCIPNTDATTRYLDERRLRLLRKDALLVNVGRGNFIDCEALARVMAEGQLWGAALDVTEPEPLPVGHPLWQQERCSITPHAAGGAFGKSAGTEDRICDVTCENLRCFLTGEPLTHVVIEG